MNLLNILSTGELYRLAGYSTKLQQFTPVVPNPVSESYKFAESATGYQAVFNWTFMQYQSISPSIKKILGYDAAMFLNRGLNFALSVVHPADLELLREIHKAIFNFYYSTPAEQRGKLRFSYNIRMRTDDNNYVTMLRQSSFVSFTNDGKPTLEYINCTDITGFKFNNAINLTVHKLSPGGTYVLCHETEFSELSQTLSKREKEVLELAKQGFTSKEIAGKLYLCIETVKSHRKHIIAKTGGGNMAAAINKIARL
ncbi:MAG: hypothetical protein EOO93_08815 [Pedobacter sp.]|nr:MAG: hypothetical protein EOO93_08815 [Pedobacter sp.]